MRGMVKRSALMLTPLGALLCAACTTISVDGPKPINCTDLLPEQLTEDTPHAPPPASDASKDWVNFGVGEAGQLNKANKDKQIIVQICRKVDGLNADMLKQARKRTKVLGVF